MTLIGSTGMTFRAAAGGVTGRDHRRAHRDGQDGSAIVKTPAVTAAIVTDGCSSGRTSEVGARLGAAWLAELVANHFAVHEPLVAAHEVTSELVTRLRETALSLSSDDTIDPRIVGEMLLFGFLAAVVTSARRRLRTCCTSARRRRSSSSRSPPTERVSSSARRPPLTSRPRWRRSFVTSGC